MKQRLQTPIEVMRAHAAHYIDMAKHHRQNARQYADLRGNPAVLWDMSKDALDRARNYLAAARILERTA